MNRLKFNLVLGGIVFLLSSIACSRLRSWEMLSDYGNPTYISFIDSVRKYSSPGETSFQITFNSLDDLNKIDPDLVKSFLSGFSTTYPEPWEIEFYDYSTCYYFDYREYKSWVSFSILVDNESGFSQLYQYTYQKSDGKISSVSRIGAYEGDGGATRNDTFTYSESGEKLRVITQYYYDQDIDYTGGRDHCYTRSFDSIVSNFHFFPDKTEFSMDTVFSSLDTLCY